MEKRKKKYARVNQNPPCTASFPLRRRHRGPTIHHAKINVLPTVPWTKRAGVTLIRPRRGDRGHADTETRPRTKHGRKGLT